MDRIMATTYKDSQVWQQSMQLAYDMYNLTALLPAVERLNLALQLQQAAVDIPSRIASGSRSGSRTGLLTACEDALDLLAQVETLLIIAGQKYPDVDVQPLLSQHDHVEEQLQGLLRRLKQQPKKIM